MHKYLLLLFILCAGAFTGKAQNRATVTGKLIDSANKAPVELATVAVVNIKDTTASLVSYTLSDKNGVFTLHNLPAGIPLKILITFVGYNAYRKFITLTKGESVNLGTITLSSKILNEVSIIGERPPIVMRKDTIEFNAEAFKTRPNAVVEELLKKLPGVEVDNSGTITVNGKAITKILIDGKEFFVNDPKIASQNLDASLIDKVQVYDDRENDPDHLIEESKVNKIINLKFKKALKKSVFGKIYAGGGTQGRFESGGLLNFFRDTLQVSFIGLANNLNKTGFSREELDASGGFNRGGRDAFNGGALGGQGYGGTQTVATAGFNLNYDYGKKFKLNLVYYLSHTLTNYNYKYNNQQFLGDTVLSSNAETYQQNADTRHTISTDIKWKPDTLTEIRYNAQLSIYDKTNATNGTDITFSNFIPAINSQLSTGSGNESSTGFQHSFSYYKRLKKKGGSFTLSHSLNISPDLHNNFSDNQVISYTATLPSTDLNRYNNVNSTNINANVSASFRYPFSKKLTADISLSASYGKNGSNELTYNFNPVTNQYNIYLDSLSSLLNRYQNTESLHPGITYNFTKKISLVAGLSSQWQQIDNQFNKNIPDLNQNYLFFLPNVRLTLGDVSLNYDAGISQPSVSDLQPIKYVYNPLYTYTGNPDLKPTKRNNFSANYYHYKPETQVSLYFNASGTIEENSIYRRTTISGLGATTSSPVNRDGQYNWYMGGGFYKRFKKTHDFIFSASTNLSSYLNHRFFQLNSDEGFQDTYAISANQRFGIYWKDNIDLEPSYSISRSATTYQGVNYNNITYFTHNVNTKLTAHLPGKFDIESSYTYTYNPLVTPGYQRNINLVSANIARQLLKKDRGEIKLSCYDIFDQNTSAYRYAGTNSIADVQSQILKRYFLLTLQFKFNKTTTK